MLNVRVTITGDKEEIAKLKKLGDKLTDFSSAMKTLGGELKTYYGGEVFASEGGAIGHNWQDLSPVYRAWKGKHYPGRGILVASGEMKRDFRATSDKNSVMIDNTRTVNGRNLLSIHQEGKGHMPIRPVLVINKAVEDIAGHVIKDDVEAKLKEIF